MWQQDGNQDATERIEEDVVKGESKGPFAKAVEGSGDSGSSSLGLNRSTEMEYQAALPLLIAERSVAVPDDLSARISALLVEMARFDVELGQRADNVPTMLLRSESSASSQIDRLTSTAQSVALAELYPKASSDARLVVANMIATQRALELPAGLSLEGIVEIHDLLLDNSHLENQTNSAFEKLRQKPVWLGGTSFTPHTALFVPPAFQHVPEYMADLIEFGTRSDLNPVVKAAILYAQFQTVHPFLTANGQTGRALIHHIFRAEGVLSSTLIPVSVGFLHNIDSLINALQSYREGDPLVIIEELVSALELALFVSRVTETSIGSLLEDWDSLVGHRKGSKIRQLPKTLVKQPVVNSAYLADSLGVTQRTATTLILRACEYGMLRHMGKRQRGDFYQSDAIINVLDEINEASTFRNIRIA
ncbi:MAG: Fic family protein [Eggerthellaceae bacterium]|nr:Fic family protein [Eggerthellaceae bacterium]